MGRYISAALAWYVFAEVAEVKEHWSDIEVILQSDEPKLELYAHVLLRDRHLPLIDLFKKEIRGNFEAITAQK